MSRVSYTEARDRLATLWNESVSSREPVTIDRRGHESMVLVPITEWEGLLETAHLLRSPANARRLLEALTRLEQGEGLEQSTADLAARSGLK